MASEIERRWVLEAVPDLSRADAGVDVRQGYLTEAGGAAEVRVRDLGGTYFMTVKSKAGLSRVEEELEIDRERFESLWALTQGRRIEKRRYRIGREPVIEVDVYAGDLDGLVTAEAEFGSEAEAASFEPPDWLRHEVTGEPGWSNASLAVDGLPSATEMSESDPRQYRFRSDEPLDAAARRAAAGRAEHALEQLRAARGSNGDEARRAKAVHETRKDLKKARSVLRLVRDGLGKERYREQNSRLRDAARQLAGARDAEVKIATLDLIVAEEDAGSLSPDSVARLRESLEAERARHSGDAHLAERVDEAREAIERGRLEISGWELPEGWKAVSKGLARSYGRGRARYAEVQHDPSNDEAVHEWRKRVKDLWYHLRLLRDAWEGVLAATVDELDELSDLLGDHHDLSVLIEEIEARMPEPDGDRTKLIELARRRQERLLTAAFPIADRVYAERTRDFVARLRSYWGAWGAEEEQEPDGWAR
ncbi:CHAD domain-containing protein [Thermoleophilia bacterium SCSIO 60948]|nr:CHAD domain-containing protein [Thermoleophilia bacterium SCSIO 60948]